MTAFPDGRRPWVLTDPEAARRLLRRQSLGTRIVARVRVAGGYRDLLGELVDADELGLTVLTRHGRERAAWADVVAGKPVPPPPAPRGRRS